MTVVIPVYNGEAFLEETVRSAASQTYGNLDVLVINDGSTDGTEQLLQKLADELDRVSFITTENGGVAAARNHGIKNATADFVAFLDADDLWHPTKTEKQIKALLGHGDDERWAGCYALCRYIDEKNNVLDNGPVRHKRGAFFLSHLVVNHVGNGSSVLVRRDVALKLGGFDVSYGQCGIGGCEDYEFQLKFLREYKMEVVQEYLVGYRQHPSSLSKKQQPKMARCQMAVVEKYVEDPRVTPTLRRLVKASLHGYIWVLYANGRQWASALGSFVTPFCNDPSEAVYRLRTRFQKKGGKWQKFWGAGSKAASLESPGSFYDMDPADVPVPAASQTRVARDRRLDRFDEGFEFTP